MKRLPRSQTTTISPIRLYLDDVKELVTLFESVNQKVTIEAGGYQLDSFEEFSELERSSLTELTLRIYEPHVALEIHGVTAMLYRAVDSPVALGVFAGAENIVRKRRIIWRRILEAWWGPMLLGPAAGFLIPEAFITRKPSIALLALALLTALIAWSALVIYLALRPGAGIALTTRENRPPILRNYAAELVIATAAVIIGGLILAYFTWHLGLASPVQPPHGDPPATRPLPGTPGAQ